jgi:hypothetical protein
MKLYVYSWAKHYGDEPMVGKYKDLSRPSGRENMTYAECVKDAEETVERDGGVLWLYEATNAGALTLIRSFGKPTF